MSLCSRSVTLLSVIILSAEAEVDDDKADIEADVVTKDDGRIDDDDDDDDDDCCVINLGLGSVSGGNSERLSSPIRSLKAANAVSRADVSGSSSSKE